MSGKSGSFEVLWNEANLAAAYRLHCSRAWQRSHSYWAGFVFAGAFFLILFSEESALDAFSLGFNLVVAIVIGAALVGLILFANRFGSGAQARRWAKEYNLDGAITRFEYDDVGLRIVDRMFGGEMRWSEARNFLQNEEFLLIYRSPQFYYYMSKRDVSEAEIAKLVSTMQVAGVPER